MVKPLMIGNWKMHGNRAMIKSLCTKIAQKGPFENVNVVVCPPAIYAASVVQQAQGFSVGGQNLSVASQGAYTGEISGAMLKDIGCEYVIVGHSERRGMFGETNQTVSQKVKQAFANGLIPILCVGETQQQRQQGVVEAVLESQINTVFESLTAAEQKQLIVAYEPVWAIGTGLVANQQQIATAHQLIRQAVRQWNATVATQLPILYGGSLKPSNAEQILAIDGVDGGLVGGASLKADKFIELIQLAKL